MPAERTGGLFRLSRKVIVYDPEINPRRSSSSYVFDADTSRMLRYPRATLSNTVERLPSDDSRVGRALAAYEAWLNEEGTTFAADQRRRREESLVVEQTYADQFDATADAHASFLRDRGIDYTDGHSVRVTPTKQREAHCYNCKAQLSTKVDIECCRCGWMVCTCGACGCGYGQMFST